MFACLVLDKTPGSQGIHLEAELPNSFWIRPPVEMYVTSHILVDYHFKIEIKSEHLRHLKRTFHGTLSMLRSLSRGGSGLFYKTQNVLSNTKCFIKQKKLEQIAIERSASKS